MFRKAALNAVIALTFVAVGLAAGELRSLRSEGSPPAKRLASEPPPADPKEAVKLKPGLEVIDRQELKFGSAEVQVDAVKNCLYVADQTPDLKHGAVRVDLEHGVTYTVKVSGEAFMSEETGSQLDPFPGVVLFYGTDEEDSWAVRYKVLKPGEALTFRTPSLIGKDEQVFLLAFFLSAWPEAAGRHHGQYTLTFTRG